VRVGGEGGCVCCCHAPPLPAHQLRLPQPKRLDLRMMRRNSSGDTSPSPSRSASVQRGGVAEVGWGGIERKGRQCNQEKGLTG
jgi:hypothetical protein